MGGTGGGQRGTVPSEIGTGALTPIVCRAEFSGTLFLLKPFSGCLTNGKQNRWDRPVQRLLRENRRQFVGLKTEPCKQKQQRQKNAEHSCMFAGGQIDTSHLNLQFPAGKQLRGTAA